MVVMAGRACRSPVTGLTRRSRVVGGDEPPAAGGAQDGVVRPRGVRGDGASIGEGVERGGIAGDDQPRRLRPERVARGTEGRGEGEAVEGAQAAVDDG